MEVVVVYFRIIILYVRRDFGNNKNPKTLHTGTHTYRHTKKPSTREIPQIPGAIECICLKNTNYFSMHPMTANHIVTIISDLWDRTTQSTYKLLKF